MNCADPTFIRANPGQKPPRYAADADGLGYLIVGGPAEDDCWSLFVDGELLAENHRNLR